MAYINNKNHKCALIWQLKFFNYLILIITNQMKNPSNSCFTYSIKISNLYTRLIKNYYTKSNNLSKSDSKNSKKYLLIKIIIKFIKKISIKFSKKIFKEIIMFKPLSIIFIFFIFKKNPNNPKLYSLKLKVFNLFKKLLLNFHKNKLK